MDKKNDQIENFKAFLKGLSNYNKILNSDLNNNNGIILFDKAITGLWASIIEDSDSTIIIEDK